jgi:hypothetical protein
VIPRAEAPSIPDRPADVSHRTAFVRTGEVLLAESERPGADPLAAVYAY